MQGFLCTCVARITELLVIVKVLKKRKKFAKKLRNLKKFQVRTGFLKYLWIVSKKISGFYGAL